MSNQKVLEGELAQMKTVSNADGDFTCHVCNRGFKNKYTHGSSQNICIQEWNLNANHVKNIFNSVEQLNRHKKIHLNKKEFQCGICGTSFNMTFISVSIC